MRIGRKIGAFNCRATERNALTVNAEYLYLLCIHLALHLLNLGIGCF